MSTSFDEPITAGDLILPSTPKTAIDRALWNAMISHFDERLLAREELEASFELLKDEGVQAALDYIQVTVAPRLAQLQDDIDVARSAIEDLIEEGTAPNSAKLGNQPPSYYATANALALLDSDVDGRIAALVGAAPGALDTLKELADALGNDASFATTVTNALAGKLALSGGTMTGSLGLIADDVWKTRVGIGEIYLVDTSITGVDIPPSTTTGVVFVQLTAGLTGTGQYNNGKITSESVSGSAPLVLATAVVNFASSPINGRTIRLLNSEARIPRPSTLAGTLQNDAFQGHKHYGSQISFVAGNSAPLIQAGTNYDRLLVNETDGTIAGSNGTPRIANETRMKNLGVTAYMRVK